MIEDVLLKFQFCLFEKGSKSNSFIYDFLGNKIQDVRSWIEEAKK